MMRLVRTRHAAGFALAMGVITTAAAATAQSPVSGGGEATATDGLVMGDWLLRPNLELRTQGEFRRNPFDTGGEVLPSGQLASPTGRADGAVQDQWLVLTRARLGIAAERGPVRAVLELQDARAWGETPPMLADQRDTMPSTAARLAYAEVRDGGVRASYFRLGRQEVVWGEGRLLGASDWSPTGRSLDAARTTLVWGDFDFEGLAAMLVSPGALPAELQHSASGDPEGTGAQLYGLRIAWHIAPLLNVESNNLARIVRQPTDGLLDPGDLYLAGLRLSGEYLTLSYSVEGAYELGRAAVVDATRSRKAYAGVARVGWRTGLPWKLRVGAQGAYASGQKEEDPTSPQGDRTRFDPILPDVRDGHGAMGLYAWSNIIEGAGTLELTPMEDAHLTLGYRYVSLVEPTDTWQTAALLPVGRDLNNTSTALGQELDASIAIEPWAPVRVVAGYGAFLTGEGGKNLLAASGRGRPDLQHYGYLQFNVSTP